MKTRVKNQTAKTAAAAVCLLLGMSGCSLFSHDVVSGTIGQNVVTAMATVKALDLATREVTLQSTDGSTIRIHAGDQVRNLDQVKVGDTVRVTYYQSLAYDVRKPGDGAPGVTAAEELARAKPGDKPAGAAGRVITVTATITAIDKSAMMVTLKGPDGDMVTVKARDPKKLDRVAVGDLVNITYTEAFAIAVETPGSK
jgi:Cu/Ag efflux protein CusF